VGRLRALSCIMMSSFSPNTGHQAFPRALHLSSVYRESHRQNSADRKRAREAAVERLSYDGDEGESDHPTTPTPPPAESPSSKARVSPSQQTPTPPHKRRGSSVFSALFGPRRKSRAKQLRGQLLLHAHESNSDCSSLSSVSTDGRGTPDEQPAPVNLKPYISEAWSNLLYGSSSPRKTVYIKT